MGGLVLTGGHGAMQALPFEIALIGGAAIGTKLAAPDKTVVALSGDGCYMFSIPSTVHWMAAKYETPFLQVVYNNRGW